MEHLWFAWMKSFVRRSEFQMSILKMLVYWLSIFISISVGSEVLYLVSFCVHIWAGAIAICHYMQYTPRIDSFAGVKYWFEMSKHRVSYYFSCEPVQLSKMPSVNWWSKCPYTSPAASNTLVNIADPRPVNIMHCQRYLKCCADTLFNSYWTLHLVRWCLWLTLAFPGAVATPLISGSPVQ